MTVATRRGAGAANVVAEIAARRREDLAAELGAIPSDTELAAAPAPRGLA